MITGYGGGDTTCVCCLNSTALNAGWIVQLLISLYTLVYSLIRATHYFYLQAKRMKSLVTNSAFAMKADGRKSMAPRRASSAGRRGSNGAARNSVAPETPVVDGGEFTSKEITTTKQSSNGSIPVSPSLSVSTVEASSASTTIKWMASPTNLQQPSTTPLDQGKRRSVTGRVSVVLQNGGTALRGLLQPSGSSTGTSSANVKRTKRSTTTFEKLRFLILVTEARKLKFMISKMNNATTCLMLSVGASFFLVANTAWRLNHRHLEPYLGTHVGVTVTHVFAWCFLYTYASTINWNIFDGFIQSSFNRDRYDSIRARGLRISFGMCLVSYLGLFLLVIPCFFPPQNQSIRNIMVGMYMIIIGFTLASGLYGIRLHVSLLSRRVSLLLLL